MNFFGKERGDREAFFIAKLHDVPLKKAKRMIQDKVRGKIDGAPGALRRAFQFFDRDRNGQIDHDEFVSALKVYTSLDFDQPTLDRLFAHFDPEKVVKLFLAEYLKATADLELLELKSD
jgi:hypothetical protein